MPLASRAYTPTEAAAVSGVAVKSVHNAIDKRIIAPRASGRSGRALSDDDLLRLKLWYGLGSILSAERRKRLFDHIDSHPDAATVRADDYLIVDVARAREQLAERAQALLEAEDMVETNKGILGGEPVFRNTRIGQGNCSDDRARRKNRSLEGSKAIPRSMPNGRTRRNLECSPSRQRPPNACRHGGENELGDTHRPALKLHNKTIRRHSEVPETSACTHHSSRSLRRAVTKAFMSTGWDGAEKRTGT